MSSDEGLSKVSIENAKKPREEVFHHGDWTFVKVSSHILDKQQTASFCRELKLPHLPDMVFSQNLIRIAHKSGHVLELNPLDALKKVNDHEDLIHVSLSKDWLEARKDSPHIHKIVRPYDWTYTPTDYRGSLDKLKVTPTEQRIDYQKLQEKEKILFFEEVILYEDELDDNGCSVLSAKLRVMPSGFFCLLRFYLRVDNTLIRVIDSRFHHEFGNNFILREYTERESKISDLKVPLTVWRDPNEITQHLELKKEVMEKLTFIS